MIDYVAYIDTDSLFLMIGEFLNNNGISRGMWEKIPQDTRTDYCITISKIIENVVNDRAYNETQLTDYNSIVEYDDFRIDFKQEIVCPASIFLAPKMYCFNVVNEEGFSCDKIEAKGIEIVRSNSPKVFRNVLKELIERILKGDDDNTLRELIDDKKSKFYSSIPEDISTNIGVNNISEYVDENNLCSKGTPYQVRGAANYHWLLNEFDLNWKYEKINTGDKCKVVYIKNNKYGIRILSYYEYPQEFLDNGILPDYNVMIEKHFEKKARIILDPLNRGGIVDGRSVEDEFF